MPSARTALAVLMLGTASLSVPAQDLDPERPSVLIVVADDLGYSDLGVYGGEIETPNFDALAESGLIFTSFYANASCSPTRAMLLSGTDNHVGRESAAARNDARAVGGVRDAQWCSDTDQRPLQPF